MLKKLGKTQKVILISFAAILLLCTIFSVCSIFIALLLPENTGNNGEVAGVEEERAQATNLNLTTLIPDKTTISEIEIAGTVDKSTKRVLINSVEVELKNKDNQKYFF